MALFVDDAHRSINRSFVRPHHPSPTRPPRHGQDIKTRRDRATRKHGNDKESAGGGTGGKGMHIPKVGDVVRVRGNDDRGALLTRKRPLPSSPGLIPPGLGR